MKNVNLFKILQDNYNIQITGIEKNLESTEGNVYLVKSIYNKYIIKIYKDIKHTESMVNLYNFLGKNNFYVPEIIKTKTSEYYLYYDNKYIVMYSFLAGKQFKYLIEETNNDFIKKLAKEIRKLHDTTRKDNFNLKAIPIKTNFVFQRNSILHFDLTKDNIFVNQNKIGFIDFDDAKYGPSIYDVAIAISLLFFSKSRGAETDKIKTFIDSYYDNDKEYRIIEIPYIKIIALKWIDYIITENNFNTSTKESFETKRILIQNNL